MRVSQQRTNNLPEFFYLGHIAIFLDLYDEKDYVGRAVIVLYCLFNRGFSHPLQAVPGRSLVDSSPAMVLDFGVN